MQRLRCQWRECYRWADGWTDGGEREKRRRGDGDGGSVWDSNSAFFSFDRGLNTGSLRPPPRASELYQTILALVLAKAALPLLLSDFEPLSERRRAVATVEFVKTRCTSLQVVPVLMLKVDRLYVEGRWEAPEMPIAPIVNVCESEIATSFVLPGLAGLDISINKKCLKVLYSQCRQKRAGSISKLLSTVVRWQVLVQK